MNVRELVGLTRDDIARLQRLVALNRPLFKDRSQLLAKLTQMVGDFQEAEGNDRDLLTQTMGRVDADATKRI
jgi:hypothetical protein